LPFWVLTRAEPFCTLPDTPEALPGFLRGSRGFAWTLTKHLREDMSISKRLVPHAPALVPPDVWETLQKLTIGSPDIWNGSRETSPNVTLDWNALSRNISQTRPSAFLSSRISLEPYLFESREPLGRTIQKPLKTTLQVFPHI